MVSLAPQRQCADPVAPGLVIKDQGLEHHMSAVRFLCAPMAAKLRGVASLSLEFWASDVGADSLAYSSRHALVAVF